MCTAAHREPHRSRRRCKTWVRHTHAVDAAAGARRPLGADRSNWRGACPHKPKPRPVFTRAPVPAPDADPAAARRSGCPDARLISVALATARAAAPEHRTAGQRWYAAIPSAIPLALAHGELGVSSRAAIWASAWRTPLPTRCGGNVALGSHRLPHRRHRHPRDAAGAARTATIRRHRCRGKDGGYALKSARAERRRRRSSGICWGVRRRRPRHGTRLREPRWRGA